MKLIIGILALSGLAAAQSAQAPSPVQQSTGTMAQTGSMPIYRVTVVARTMKAINYNHRSGSTRIDFRGTALLPEAHGEASVESKQGVTKIDARMEKLQPATKFGPEYLTYVMWAITPEGRATNVGEVILNGDKTKLDATTELQSFGLIVTAEPYFAVTQPSDVVVMENFVRRDTTGTIEQVDAKFELLQRGQYIVNVNPADIKPMELGSRVPLDLYEARNAVQIARWTGAERYAPDTYQKAVQGLENAEGYLIGRSGSKPIDTVAREAVQMAEDARIITIKKIAEETLAGERQAGAEREALAESGRAAAQDDAARVAREAERARFAAQMEANRVQKENDGKMAVAQNDADLLKIQNDARGAAAQGEIDRLKSDNASQLAASQTETDRLRRESDARGTAAQGEIDRLKGDNASQLAASQTETDRLRRENDARGTAAQGEIDRLKGDNASQLAASQTETDRLRHENEVQKASAQADMDRATKEKVDLRALLLSQFNAILQTRDTVRGLVVNVSDVLFDTGKYSLRPLAREKLAKVAGIVSGHPGLRLDVQGYTDSVGGDDYNQKLSENRGGAVRDYLTSEGMASSSVQSEGFGKSQPVATNDTAEGRQLNRRVEIVISGEIIGTEIGSPIALR
jgi:outer membrane protein OmpA-like peptidoglycan-associated protein